MPLSIYSSNLKSPLMTWPALSSPETVDLVVTRMRAMMAGREKAITVGSRLVVPPSLLPSVN